ncbi:MAG: hypothetical protein ABTQ31_13385 [Rhizobiaceae bacterium]
MIHHQLHLVRPDRVQRALPRRLLAGEFFAPCRRSEPVTMGPTRRPLDR